jgi:hypothetical protein
MRMRSPQYVPSPDALDQSTLLKSDRPYNPPPSKAIALDRLAVADTAIVKEQYYLFRCQRETLISS